MPTEYRLIIAGGDPVTLAERAFPAPDDRPTGTPTLLATDLSDRYGYEVTVRGGTRGYVEIDSARGPWEWEPSSYVALTFRLDKDAETGPAVRAVVLAVRRVLSTGPEDAALTLNTDTLLLTRFGGALNKRHRDEWWSHYAGTDQLIEESAGPPAR